MVPMPVEHHTALTDGADGIEPFDGIAPVANHTVIVKNPQPTIGEHGPAPHRPQGDVASIRSRLPTPNETTESLVPR